MNILIVSPEAWAKVHEKLILTESKSVRIGVKTTGCNGYSYTFNVSSDEPQSSEFYLQEGDHYVIVEPDAEKYFQGVELTWEGADPLSKHFAFRNPIATGECGCGESFSI